MFYLPKYFVDSSYAFKKICDSIRVAAFINHHIFIPKNSHCCSNHIVDTDLKSSALDSIRKCYEKSCLIKINELMEMFEKLKMEFKKHVSYTEIHNLSSVLQTFESHTLKMTVFKKHSNQYEGVRWNPKEVT